MSLEFESYKNPIAEVDFQDSGIIVTPVEANRKGIYFCPDADCKDPQRRLVLTHSRLGNPYFAHKQGFYHSSNFQTMLHKMAIRWYFGKQTVRLPNFVNVGNDFNIWEIEIDPAKTQLEFSGFKSFIPDVLVQTTSGLKVAIEIIVSNDVSSEKLRKIEAIGIPVVAIYLTDFFDENEEECRSNPEFVRTQLNVLLNDTLRMDWIAVPEMNAPRTSDSNETPGPLSSIRNVLICLGIVIGVIWLCILWVSKKKFKILKTAH